MALVVLAVDLDLAAEPQAAEALADAVDPVERDRSWLVHIPSQ